MLIFPALHIPDGFLSLHVSGAGWLLLGLSLFVALGRLRQQQNAPSAAMMGVVAAFIFAAQMINFPVTHGTSGHLLGGVLAAILLGPWAAILVMTLVVGVQAIVFQDGGMLALGFNVVNMGVLTSVVGYVVYQRMGRRLTTAAFAAWVSVMLAAAATSLQLALSGTSPLHLGLPAMLGVHALIGVGEALITAAVLVLVQRTRPSLMQGTSNTRPSTAWAIAALMLALLVVVAAPLASPAPDGLERVAIDHAFDGLAQAPLYELLPDYTLSTISQEALSTIAAGMVGVLLVASLGFGLSLSLRRQEQPARF